MNKLIRKSESLKCKNEDHGKNAKAPVTAGMKEQGSSEDRKGKVVRAPHTSNTK